MAVLAISFLKALSVHGAEQLLLQEGYMEEARIERRDAADRAAFFTPYALYGAGGNLLDRIYYIESCERVPDVEYEDGRMTWEELRVEWSRQGPALWGGRRMESKHGSAGSGPPDREGIDHMGGNE